MAATPQTLLIPFKGGLDTYSNAHLLPAGFLTSSLGTMLDRPGTAYPGPGFSVTQWAQTPTAAFTNHGIGALNHGPGTNLDQLVLWATQSDGGFGPGISGPSNSSIAITQQALAPWRQATQRFSSDSLSFISSAYGYMGAPPQCAVSGGFAFYAWVDSNNAVMMAYQDLSTHAWKGPYFLNSAAGWSTYAGDTAMASVAQMALGGDGTYLRLAYRVGNALHMTAYAVTAPTVRVDSIFTVSGTFTIIDGTSTGDEAQTTGYGVFIGVDEGSHKLRGYTFDSTSYTFGSGVDILTGLSNTYVHPITCAPVRTNAGASTGFMFGAMNSSTNKVILATSSLTLTSIASNTFTAIGTFANARAMSVTNLTSGSAGTLGVAVEYYPGAQTVLGHSFAWNYVCIAAVTFGAPSSATSVSTIRGWGGMALLGKFYPWFDGAEMHPLIPLRSGWFNVDGTWPTAASVGTASFAYPNGYLYDHKGVLYGKFGDADVGTNTMWPTASSSNYRATAMQPITNGFRYTLTSGQQTLSYGWPQYGHVDFFSTNATVAGTPVGTRAGLSTVTWLAPTASEPAAPMVQFAGSLVIPGTITAYFDGSNVFEAGFFHRAPTPILQSNGGGGVLPNATTYYYQTVMTYQDAAGRIHRSAPSLRVPVVTTMANDAIVCAVPICNQTLRIAYTNTGVVPIALEVYRSTGNPTTTGAALAMYLVTSINSLNDPTGTDFTTTFPDATPDSSLIQYETIYTYNMQTGASGGTFSPPPFDSLTVWNDQVWGLANVNGPELWCTWQQDNAELGPEGAAWSAANRLPLPAEIGQPKAVVGLDEKLLALGNRADYGIIAGSVMTRDTSILDNPGLFSAPLLLPTPGGIKTLNGVVRIPKGLLFQGTQGFNILGRDLQYTPVGMPVKDFTRSNLYLPGVFLPEQSAVLLFSASDVTKNLVFFYDTDEWAQTEQPPADATNTAPAAVMVGAVRTVAGQSSQVYALASTQPYYVTVHPFSKYMSYRTPWIELDDRVHGVRSVAGSGILREVQVLGLLPDGFTGNQTLTLYTEYDYPGNTTQLPETQTLALRSETQADLEYQWRFGFFQGNAKRVRFTVTVNGGVRAFSDTDDAPVLLTGLQLSYDVDTGLSRMGASNSTGT